jgi:hypothetical protein
VLKLPKGETIISPGPSDFDLDLDAEKAGISFL